MWKDLGYWLNREDYIFFYSLYLESEVTESEGKELSEGSQSQGKGYIDW